MKMALMYYLWVGPKWMIDMPAYTEPYPNTWSGSIIRLVLLSSCLQVDRDF